LILAIISYGELVKPFDLFSFYMILKVSKHMSYAIILSIVLLIEGNMSEFCKVLVKFPRCFQECAEISYVRLLHKTAHCTWSLCFLKDFIYLREKFIFDHWILGSVWFWPSNSIASHLRPFNYQNCSHLIDHPSDSFVGRLCWHGRHAEVETTCQRYPSLSFLSISLFLSPFSSLILSLLPSYERTVGW